MELITSIDIQIASPLAMEWEDFQILGSPFLPRGRGISGKVRDFSSDEFPHLKHHFQHIIFSPFFAGSLLWEYCCKYTVTFSV